MNILLILFLIFLAVALPFSIYMERKSRREFFEKNGRYPDADDYLDHGMWP